MQFCPFWMAEEIVLCHDTPVPCRVMAVIRSVLSYTMFPGSFCCFSSFAWHVPYNSFFFLTVCRPPASTLLPFLGCCCYFVFHSHHWEPLAQVALPVWQLPCSHASKASHPPTSNFSTLIPCRLLYFFRQECCSRFFPPTILHNLKSLHPLLLHSANIFWVPNPRYRE